MADNNKKKSGKFTAASKGLPPFTLTPNKKEKVKVTKATDTKPKTTVTVSQNKKAAMEMRTNRKFNFFLAFQRKLHGKCSFPGCEETDPCCLDFHHLDKSTKRGNIPNLYGIDTKQFKIELDSCILLCANHHRILHNKEDKTATYLLCEKFYYPKKNAKKDDSIKGGKKQPLN